MLTLLLLALAAAPEAKSPPRVLIRLSLDGMKSELIGDLIANELERGRPQYTPLRIREEAKAKLEELQKRVFEDCKRRISDTNVTTCQFNMLDATEGRVFSKGADLVLDVFAEQLVEKPNIIMNLALWDPQTGKGQRVRKPVLIARFPEEVLLALMEVLEGGGVEYQRPVKLLDELTFPGFKKDAVVRGLPVVFHGRGCLEPVPPKLKITPDDGLARTIADRWQTSIADHPLGKQPESCTLTYLPLSDTAVLVHVTFTCGALTSTSLFHGTMPRAESFDLISEHFLTRLLESHCVGAVGEPPNAALLFRYLIGQLSSDQHESVMEDLVNFGPKTVPALVSALDDPQPLVRQRVAETLSYFGTAARDAVPALEKATKDPDAGVAAAAQAALQKIRG